MKTFNKILYYREYSSPIAYGYTMENKIKSYVKIQINFDFKNWLWFSVTIPNVAIGNRNIFKALLMALEHESIGMAKYNRIKEDTRRNGLWKKLKTS
jgi:hypothetical protein